MIGLILTIIGFIIIAIIAHFYLKKLSGTAEVENTNINSNSTNVRGNVQGGNRNSQNNTNNTNNQPEIDQTNNNIDSNQNIAQNISTNRNNTFQPAVIDPNKKYTKKEMHKMEKKQAKEETREYQRQFNEQKKLREDEKEREYKEREMKREEERLKEEELLSRLKQEQAEKEQKEYDQWKGGLVVAEEGVEQADLESENLINDFIEYIKLRKVVALEDLAGNFKINPNEIAERLKALESAGKICGIIDDRGKYIYLTEKELLAIEKIFVTRGRISKAELIKECNKLIRFEPTEEDKIKIAEEQDRILQSLELDIKDNKENK